MTDELDLASEREELMRQSALYRQSKAAVREAEPTGSCLYCEEPLSDGLRWCNADCRDDWERERKRR
ncbi:hypothetical protein V9W64_10550 [Neisseria leonii]|uniref:DUF2116 family Zn-ribbon domain-containing protein n=1 Tax=Neisseria leonii TaxID=2995413 RepID=A0A9X4E288_9NEIS|nr:hypothetical protein [Neisseria sp. 51.81]MDD9328237.1 hypothetical protein [Neisseria sp. 51.81]